MTTENTTADATARAIVKVTVPNFDIKGTNNTGYINFGSVLVDTKTLKHPITKQEKTVLIERDQIKVGINNANFKKIMSSCKNGDYIFITGKKIVNRFVSNGVECERIDITEVAEFEPWDLSSVMQYIEDIKNDDIFWDKVIPAEYKKAEKTIKDIIAPKASKSEIETALSGSEFPDVGF